MLTDQGSGVAKCTAARERGEYLVDYKKIAMGRRKKVALVLPSARS
jgi:hypothetical protein